MSLSLPSFFSTQNSGDLTLTENLSIPTTNKSDLSAAKPTFTFENVLDSTHAQVNPQPKTSNYAKNPSSDSSSDSNNTPSSSSTQNTNSDPKESAATSGESAANPATPDQASTKPAAPASAPTAPTPASTPDQAVTQAPVAAESGAGAAPATDSSAASKKAEQGTAVDQSKETETATTADLTQTPAAATPNLVPPPVLPQPAPTVASTQPKAAADTKSSPDKAGTPVNPAIQPDSVQAENNSVLETADSTNAQPESTLTFQSLAQMQQYLQANAASGGVDKEKSVKNEATVSLSEMLSQSGTAYATYQDMEVQNQQYAQQISAGAGSMAALGLQALATPLKAGAEILSALSSSRDLNSIDSLSPDANPAAGGNITQANLPVPTTFASDKLVRLDANAQFPDVIKNALLENPLPNPSRLTINLQTPGDAIVTVYFTQQGKQIRAQLSSDSEVSMQWLTSQISHLRTMETGQSVIWLPPQLEARTSPGFSNFQQDAGKFAQTDAEREAESLGLTKVLATSAGGSDTPSFSSPN